MKPRERQIPNDGAKVPRPPALRLFRLETGARAKAPPPPFGLRTWSGDAPALAVVLDASACDVDSAAEVAAHLPEPTSLSPGTRVFVLGAASRGAGLLRRLLGSLPVTREVRCTALLARGYLDIGAGVDAISRADLAWGTASSS